MTTINEYFEWHEEIDELLQEIVTELQANQYIDAAVKIGIIIEKNAAQHKKMIEEDKEEDDDD